MASPRLAPAPSLDLASLRLDAGAVLFGRLDSPLEGSAPEPGALARCLHVTVRLEGDGGVSRATTACRARAHDAYDPDDPSDDRSRWWRSVVTPFHDARPRPSPGPVAPAVARDFALQLDDAEVGARGVLTVAVSPEARRACVLLREPFEIARAAHELPPRRLPSVVDACGAAYAETLLSAEPRASLGIFPPSLILFVTCGALLALLAAAVSSPAVAFRLAEAAYRIRRRVSAAAERWHAAVSERATRLARPPLPLRRPRGSKAPLGAWRVRRLLRERSAGRPPFPPRGSRREARRSSPEPMDLLEDDDGFLFDAQATWALRAAVADVEDVEDVDASPGGEGARGRERREEPLAFDETALGSGKNEKTKKRSLVRAFLGAPPTRPRGFEHLWPHTCAARDSGGWDSTSSCAMTDVPSGTRVIRAGHESSARNASSTLKKKTSSRDGFETPETCFAVAYGRAFSGNAEPEERHDVRRARVMARLEPEERLESGDPGSPDTAGNAGDGPFLVRMFGGRADAAPADADLRVLAEDVFRAGAFGDATVVSVADGAPDLRLRVRFGAEAAATQTRSSRSSPKNAPAHDPFIAAFGDKRGRARRRTSAAFEFRGVSESPMHFAGLDAATGEWRRARAGRRAEE